MNIEILGSGCDSCDTLDEVVKKAVSIKGGFHSIQKVNDLLKIMEYQVISTPALVIDGKVKSTGKILSVDEVLEYMNEAQ